MSASDYPLPTDLIEDDLGPPEHHDAHNLLHLLQNNAVRTVSGTSDTLAIGDFFGIVECTSASATSVTVPANASVAFPVGTLIDIVQIGAGQVTVVAGGGVTIVTPGSLVLRAQYSTVQLRKRSTNAWILAGDTT